MFKWVTSLFSDKSSGDSPSSKQRKKMYVVLLSVLGIALLLGGNLLKPSEEPDSSSFPNEQNEDEVSLLKDDEDQAKDKGLVSEVEEMYEKELTEILEKIQGVSNVDVMVNLDATDLKIYEKNVVTGKQETEETDQNGGKRMLKDTSNDEQVVLVRKGDREEPILIQTKKPEVRGVLIVANGAEHMQIKQWIVEAVSRALDVPTHRISVNPKE
ncbi:stage III sporulation protein AG [Bacillaceae bacterium S4-13-58]